MEQLHCSYLKKADRWAKDPENLQLSRVEYAVDLETVNPESENCIPQEQMDGVKYDSEVSINQRQTTSEYSKAGFPLEFTLKQLTLYDAQTESNCPVANVVKLFNASPLLPGIMLTDEGKLTGLISRRRFFEYMSRPYSWQLFSKLRIQAIYQVAKTETIVLPSNTTIVAAARRCLRRSPDTLYEPVIVLDGQGVYKLLDVHELLLAQSEIHDSVAQALRQAETKYRSIFENAVDGIFQTTPDGHYISANPALARIYGFDSVQELIETVTDVGKQVYVDPNRRAEFIAAVKEQGAVSQFESQVYRKDGSIIWISENARAVYDDNGTLLYYEGTVEDNTERKQAEVALRNSEAQLRKQATELEETLYKLQKTQAQLIQTEKMSSLGQLLAGVAHEISNPVNSIYNNIPHANEYIEDLLYLLQLYAKHYPQPLDEIEASAEDIDLEFLIEDLPKTLTAMQVGAERIREIVLTLRNFSRLDECKMKLGDVHQGIDSTLLILHHRLKAKGERKEIEVIKEYGNLPPVECYTGQLNQVFMNLLGNAIDALEEVMCDGEANTNTELPTIWIRTEVLDNRWVRISIADNADGMTEDICQRMFEPFFTTKPIGKGTGLGLSISHQIVEEKHGGKLKCKSAPGLGTEFIMEIPIQQKRESDEE